MNILGQIMRYAIGVKGKNGMLDLNVSPPVENLEHPGGPAVPVAQGGEGGVPAARGGHIHQPAGSTRTPLIDVEDLDDDVVISSPRAFEEAINKSQRRQRTLVVDVEHEEAAVRNGLIQANKRRRGPPNPPILNSELPYVNLEGSSNFVRGGAQYITPSPPPPPPPKEPTFSCPVCIGPLVEEVTTRCGHIFCKACIEAAMSAHHKCPTCRRKITKKAIFRVYLPTTR